jgi:hypothetical protein
MERQSREYKLAERILHLEDALNTANKNAKRNGMLGVIANTCVSFSQASAFHARVRKILKEI